MITAMRNENHIDEICTTSALGRDGYYPHLRKPSSRRRCEDEALRPKIAASFENGSFLYAAPHICRVTIQESTPFSGKRIGHLMCELGLWPLQNRGFIQQTTRTCQTSRPAPDLLLDRPVTTTLDQIWSCDKSCVQMNDDSLHPASVMDRPTRLIPGRGAADKMRTEPVSDAVERASFTRARVNLAAYVAASDSGSESSSANYSRELPLMPMHQSIGGSANCYSNATMESVRDPIKIEVAHSMPTDRAHVRLFIHDYINAF
jgi:putative transposase